MGLALAVSVMTLGCAGGPPSPAPLDTKTETCRSCRMPVSDASLSAQIVAPGEEPRFFDDLGCLRDYLARFGAPRSAVVYVADHRTRSWIRASSAVFTRTSLETPMGSHWIAHADVASRDADPAAAGGSAVAPREILGSSRSGEGR